MKHLLSLNLFGELLIITTVGLILLVDIQFAGIDLIVFCNIVWLAGTFISKNYYINRRPGVLINSLNLSKFFVVYYLIVFFYSKLLHEQELSNQKLIHFCILLYLLLIEWRVVVFLFLKFALKNSKNKQNIIIVGISYNSIQLNNFINAHPEYGLNVLGFFSDKKSESVPVLGDYEAISNYCSSNSVSEIICSADMVSKDFLTSLIDFAENNLISIKLIPDSAGVFGRNFVTTFFEHIPLLSIRKNPFDEIPNQILKRGFDILFSLFVIIFVLSWLYPIIAILILFDSKGPVLFIQERTGLLNKSFKCLKFRTMIVNSKANELQTQKNDSRVTKIGVFLRKNSIDELPQFFNVLKGDMSIVGPRPHMIKHTEEYSQLIDKYMIRHLVKPGITGLSQVLGYRGETQHNLHLMQMRVRMDRFYIENWSFYLDLKVVYSTIISLFKKNPQVY